MKKLLITGLCGLTLTSATFADNSHQIEFGADAINAEADSNDNQTTNLSSTLYFSPVKSKGVPLAEAPFVNQSSSVSLGYSYNELERKGVVGDAETDIMQLGVRIVPTDSNILLGATVSRRDDEFNGIGSDSQARSFQLGNYLNDQNLISLHYSEVDDDVSPNAITRGLSYQTLLDLQQGTHLAAIVGYEKTDLGSEDERTWNFASTYYPDLTTGVGLLYNTTSSEPNNESLRSHEYGVKVSKFITPEFELSGQVTHQELENNSIDETTSYAIGFKYRL